MNTLIAISNINRSLSKLSGSKGSEVNLTGNQIATFLLLAITFFAPVSLWSQCFSGQIEVTITYGDGSYNEENSWLLWDATDNVELLCDDAPSTPGSYSVCAVSGHTIRLYAWETLGDNWNGATLTVEYTEDGSANGGDVLNEIIYGPNGNPGGASGNGSLDACPGGNPSNGSGGALAFEFIADVPLPPNSTCGWELQLFDSAGDGWTTGERLNISIDGDAADEYYLEYGSFESFPITVIDGGTLDQVFTLGIFSNEVSWSVIDDEGITVFTGNGSPDPNPITQINTTCLPVVPIVLSCPADVTAECSDDLSPSSQGTATYTGGTGPVSISSNDVISGGPCPNTYIITRTWTATDNIGSESCDQVITVEDSTPPIIVCPSNITIECNTDNSPTNTGLATAMDNCSEPANIVIGSADAVAAGSCPSNSVITRTWTAADECGKIQTCNQTISVEDSTPPLITCPSAVTIECDADDSPANTGQAMATDNCSDPANIAIGSADAITPGSCPNNYIITRTWTATDECGKMQTCNQAITVEDTTLPVITCPSAVTIECDADDSPANTGQAMATDNCSALANISIGSTDATTPGSCPSNYTITRTWTATDECTNSQACDQVITVQDTTSPNISCPSGITIECDDDDSPANTGQPTATDNCSDPANITFGYADVITPGSCPSSYTITRTWTATDECTNNQACDQTILVEDTTPPIINTCPPMKIVEGCTTNDIMNGGLTSQAFSTIPVFISENDFTNEGGTASDNCGIQDYIYQDAAAGTCPIVVTRTWTIKDSCDLAVVCTQIIQIDDTTPPVVTCQDITVDLDTTGELTITPGQVFDVLNSSDNCSSITLLSVTSNYFSCLNEGPNNVLLTGKDACDNTSTCTASVTITEFITDINFNATPETCAGAGDGSIFVSANASGGEIGYSVDGGANYQFSSLFSNLTPGTYNVVIKVFGIPASCEETFTITVNAGGTSPQTWHKDADDDGYSDGSSVTSCTQPTGYILNPLSGTDCDDNNADINPGATEVCDGMDNNCDGNLGPDEVDDDNDGYMICEGDCDDGDADVNPGEVEICDGIDNDCDGEIDEGVTATYVGNVLFNSQAQLDDWLTCYDKIDGYLQLTGNDITDLSPLANIIEITGNVTIYYNPSLTTLNGIENLATVGGSFFMYYNFLLSDCCAIDDLLTNNGVSGSVTIFFNASGSHCNSAPQIMADCPLAPQIINPGGGSSLSYEQSVSSIPEGTINLYPNPAHNRVTVQFNKTKSIANLQIRNLLGKMLLELELEEGVERITIDFNNYDFVSGIYLFTLIEDNKMQSEELIIQR